MKVTSTKNNAIRKRVTTHAAGKLVASKKPSLGARLETDDEERKFRVSFGAKDLPALEKIVAALKGVIPLIIVAALTSSCSTANWRTIDQIQGNYTSWGPAPGKQVTTEQARADLERCTAWANTKPGSRTAFQHRCMIENGYQIVQVND